MKTTLKSVSTRGRSALAMGLLAFGQAIAAQSTSASPLKASYSEPRAAAEGQAVVTELGGNAKAVTYWSQGPEGAVVVTTVDTVSDAETASEHPCGRPPDVGPAARPSAGNLRAAGPRRDAAGPAHRARRRSGQRLHRAPVIERQAIRRR